MRFPRRRWRIAAAATALAPLHAMACTLCHSDVSREVRERVFGPEFLPTAFAVFAPLPVFLVGIYLAGREARQGNRPL
jgi:hypothetical protein